MSIKEYDTYKKAYPVKSVSRGYGFYIRMLFEKCLGMFDYTGLPKSLPAEELEKNLIWFGFTGVFNHKKFGLTCANGGLSGIDQYYRATKFVYAQPILGSDELTINDNCIIVYNSQTDIINPYGFKELIQRYARLLADIDSSIDIQIINSRATKLNSVSNDLIAAAVNNAMQALESGDTYTVNQNSILDGWTPKDWNTAHPETIEKLIDAKQSILNAFLEEIGVKSINEKRERMITNEVSADNQLLMVNTDDLVQMRKKGVAAINEMFGTDINVELNDIYNVSKNINIIGGSGNDNDDSGIL